MNLTHRVIRVRLAVHDGELARYLRMALAADPQLNIVVRDVAADVVIGDADAPPPPPPDASGDAGPPLLFVGGSASARERLTRGSARRVAFVAKPFNAAQLRSALRALLDF